MDIRNSARRIKKRQELKKKKGKRYSGQIVKLQFSFSNRGVEVDFLGENEGKIF